MKSNHPARRLTAALLSGAMLLSLSAPALAAGPGLPDSVPAAAQALNEENTDGNVSVTINSDLYSLSADQVLDARSDFNGSISYSASTQTLTLQGASPADLTIDAPDVNVKIIRSADTADAPLVSGDLTITHSASVYISNMEEGRAGTKQAITRSATITSDGAVTIYGTDRAVGGAKLTVNAGGDVKIANNVACAAIWKDADITSGGSVTIGSNNADGWAQGNRQETSSLAVTAAGDVTLTGGGSTEPVVQSPTIACGGKLTIENTVGGSTVTGILTYTNSADPETVLRRDGNFYGAIASGKTTVLSDPAGVKKFTAAPEEKVALNLKNCHATGYTSSEHRTSFYAGETVYVYPDRPTNGLSFKEWEYPATLTLISTSDDPAFISFAMPAKPTAITAMWNMYSEASQKLDIQWNDQSVVSLTPGSFADNPTVPVGNALSVTYEDGVYTVAINSSSINDSLNLTGYTGQDGKQPSVTFLSNNHVLHSFNVEGLKDFTSENDSGNAINCDGTVTIACGGDVTISGTNNAINCDGTVTIACGGNVVISSPAKTAIYADSLAFENAENVDISGSGYFAVSCYGAAAINCSGSVTITCDTGSAVDANSLVINGAQNVSITAETAVFSGYTRSNYPADPVAAITCSGDVELKTTGGGPLVNRSAYGFPRPVTLTYHQAGGCTYTVFAGQNETSGSDLLSGEETAGRAFTLTDTNNYSYVKITPDLPPVPTDPIDPGDSAGTTGGAVAAVLVGGAAVFGGYEIATRVILNKLLPEGAAIPANRGQLALLVWNTAGRPAPAGTPAFADVTDPDTAAAAQWCVEQGYLAAKKDGRFAPDGWTPKFRVVEVWSRAFPKQ